ncbi:MAG: methyltransferase domain-containing protein, partial [Candidatus Wallbacteria bacterium]|nr:methyltransferase domain-containing protein [Candidatus Wallbacteria bacterium]
MSHEEEVRKSVAEAYGRAVTGGGSCCQPAATPVPIQLTRYDPKELETLPEGVSSSSFGCGNPFAFTEIREGQVVLDLGSGAGIDLLLARRRTGASGRVIGVDMTGPMIERARASIATAGFDNVEVREGIIEKLPVESSSVDWVISNCVINLSPRK